MSGRKASEVSALLSRGEQARNAGKTNFNSIIESSRQNIKNKEKEINSISAEIQSINAHISPESEEEFSKESKKLLSDLESVKNNVSISKYDVDFINKGISEVNKRLDKADKESRQLKDIIKTKPHYCDNEYSRADKLVQEYKDIKTYQTSIQDKAARLSNEVDIDLRNKKSSLSMARAIQKNIDKLNKKANEIVKLRAEANKAKEYVEDLISDIDSSLAEKFMKDEYIEIIKRKNNFVSLEDSRVVNEMNDICEAISIFSNTLQARYEEFKAKKAESEEKLSTVKSLIEKYKYYHPMEFIKSNDNAEQIDLYTFLNEYANGEFISDIELGIDKIQSMIDEESFEKSNIVSDEIISLIEKAANYASIKQENILKNAYMALDIRNVMRSMNYAATANIIDNDITNGFKITCTVGDEIIDFDRVLVNDDGQPIIDIDHTESVKGTCATKWPDIQQKLAETGILVKDITKNGKSILDGKQTKSINENLRNRG